MQQLKFVDFNTAIGIFNHPELGDGVWVTDMATYGLFQRAYNLSNEPIRAKYGEKVLFYLWPSRQGLSENKKLNPEK